MKIAILEKCHCFIALSVVLFTFFIIVSVQGCASSGAQRGAAGEIDKAHIMGAYEVDHMGDGNIADSYQNTSQTTKGVVLGGAAGAAAGGLSSMGAITGLLTGAVIGGAIGAYIDQTSTLSDQLINHGARVIVLGDQVMIEIPSYVIFNPMTPEIKPTARPTLDLVAKYINKHPNITVKISAYTGCIGGSEAVNLALSNQQADSVEKYLWRKGVNTRVLTAAGMGGTNLVTQNSGSWASENYRIEITFEKVPV